MSLGDSWAGGLRLHWEPAGSAQAHPIAGTGPWGICAGESPSPTTQSLGSAAAFQGDFGLAGKLSQASALSRQEGRLQEQTGPRLGQEGLAGVNVAWDKGWVRQEPRDLLAWGFQDNNPCISPCSSMQPSSPLCRGLEPAPRLAPRTPVQALVPRAGGCGVGRGLLLDQLLDAPSFLSLILPHLGPVQTPKGLLGSQQATPYNPVLPLGNLGLISQQHPPAGS